MKTEIVTQESVTPGEAPDLVRLSPHVALVLVEDGSPVLLDMNGDFYGISDMGARMLRGSLERGQAATATAIAQDFDVDPTLVAADLEGLLADLEKRGVIHREAGERRGPFRHFGARTCAALLAGIFRMTKRPTRRAWFALALARLSFGLFGWNATLEAWRTRFPKPDTGCASAVDPVIDRSVRDMAARIWLGVDCKERALSCFALAHDQGQPAEINIGVILYPLGGHCWCTSGEAVIGDDPDRSGPLIPVFRFT